jgi:Cu-processing system permease protein
VRSPILLIAMHEFTLNRRNKWVVSFAGLFTLMTFLVSYFGMITSGYSGFQDFTRTSASIINLSGFILPLFALMLGVFSFITNSEYLELLTTQPLTRKQLLLGKFTGLSFTIIGSTLVGFGIPGVIMSLVIGVQGAISFGIVVANSLILGLVFLAIALLITLLTNRQQIALGIAIAVWLFFELFYGMIMMGMTLYFSHATLKTLLLFGLLGSPVDITRVLSLLAVGGPHLFGAAGATLIKMTGSTLHATLWGSLGLLIWLVIPLVISIRLFSRQNL